jgi:hypothetical protein
LIQQHFGEGRGNKSIHNLEKRKKTKIIRKWKYPKSTGEKKTNTTRKNSIPTYGGVEKTTTHSNLELKYTEHSPYSTYTHSNSTYREKT